MSKEMRNPQSGSVWRADPKLEWARHQQGGNFSATYARDVIQLLLSHPSVVVDPFAGTGERAAAAREAGHEALGVDISPVAIKSCLNRWNLIEGSFLIGDARALPLRNDSVDLVFTSPPYWKVERYESTPGQLSDVKTYARFLVELRRSFQEMHRVLRPGGFAAVIVANFRRWGTYYAFRFDAEAALRGVGFRAWDNVVLARESVGPLGAKRSVKNKHTKVSHDELLIAMKTPSHEACHSGQGE